MTQQSHSSALSFPVRGRRSVEREDSRAVPVRPGASSPCEELGPCSLFHAAFGLSRGGKTASPHPTPRAGFLRAPDTQSHPPDLQSQFKAMKPLHTLSQGCPEKGSF